jgi:activator of 2-hydroxyglutaryl-CoA dehydratase/predicted nucleotide-binding protein (sugar kinase/HSP70/actin superfamily)
LATQPSTNTTPRGERGQLYVGMDIGSNSLHYAVLDNTGSVIYAPRPLMHFANPLAALLEAWRDVAGRFGKEAVRSTALTGSAAATFPAVMPGVSYVYDSVAIPKGIGVISPQAELVFHIGAKDTYFFSMAVIDGRRIIREWRSGTKCGGGSGMLVEKQCRRLFQGDIPAPELADTGQISDAFQRELATSRNREQLQLRIEQMLRCAQEEARKSNEPSEFLARCGVVVQSDLIHKQNEGATRVDNLAGLFKTVARNYAIDVLGSRDLRVGDKAPVAVCTGGVFGNDLVRENLEKLLDIPISRPKHFENVAAVGAAIKALEEGNQYVFDVQQLSAVAAQNRENRDFAPPLVESLSHVRDDSESLAPEIPAGTEVVIGIDGGSTTTKGALVDIKTGTLLDKLYIKTHGNPEESLKNVLRYLARHRNRVVVRGVGATGSARKLYERILLSKKKLQELTQQGLTAVDRITDEITCHALGVRYRNPKVDTIFEIGGQDMKFTCFGPDATVKEAKMNYSCQAGSGQTLENMADVINLNVESSLQEAALRAPRVPIIDSTCGVFMEMDENRLIAEGFSRDEIAAAILRGTAASYYYKFVGGAQHVGQNCSAQGGPALGRAFLAALAQVTGKQIEAYPHREMFGAWGQALDIIDQIKRAEREGKKAGTAFRGWDLVDMPFHKKKVSCRDLFADKTCGMRDCQLEVFSIESDEVITGGFCPRGNSEGVRKPKVNYVDRYHKIYEKHFKKQGTVLSELGSATPTGPTVGIKRSMTCVGEKGIWSGALFRKLGFFPVISPRSDKEIAKIGVDKSRTEFCIARKLATGHAAILNDHPGIEFLFNPSFIEERQGHPPDLKYCIYTESEGYVLNDVLSLDKQKQFNPILHFEDRPLLVREIRKEFTRVGFPLTDKQVKEALDYADAAETAFEEELHGEGDKFLERIERERIPAYVGIGRDYVVLDPEASSNSGAMFAEVRGLEYIPQIFLEHKFLHLPIAFFVENEFWVESVKILKANLYVADHPHLFPIRMINFACGPDSLKIYQEEKIQQAAGKPLLVLVTDAQTNNAPFVTRTEAHERVVSQSRPSKMDASRFALRPKPSCDQRTWLIPYMGDASHVAAAGLRAFGINGRVLPTNTPRGNEAARKHIYTEVCHPLKGVVGDAIGYLSEEIEKNGKSHVEDHYLVMLPTTSGPCRFGKYVELVRYFMEAEGLEKIPVVGPSSETDYIDIPLPGGVGALDKIKMQQVLFKGIHAADLLEDTLRRFRPYVVDRAAADRLKGQQLNVLCEIVASGGQTGDMVRWGRDTVSQFQGLELRTRERYPLVLYIGEIYMRMHDPYTGNVANQLEDNQLEIVRDPITDWLLYVNRMNLRNAKRDAKLGLASSDAGRTWRSVGKALQSILKSRYMGGVVEKLDEPFHEVLAGRHVLPHPIEIIEKLEAEHEIHGDIEGESPLSTGIAYYLMHGLIDSHNGHHGSEPAPAICGIFHVGPFTCMQEGVATAKMEAMVSEFRKIKPDLVFPVVHAFFGDSPNPNLAAEIAVFREQCYQKRQLVTGKVPGGAHKAEIRECAIRQGRGEAPNAKYQIPNKSKT